MVTGFADRVEVIRRRIADLVEDHGSELVAAYYAPRSGFAGAMFDQFGDNPDDRFTADDFVAASLLDVRFGPASVEALLVEHAGDRWLAEIPNDPSTALWTTALHPKSAPWKLWNFLTEIEDVGPTRASKLLARKRPHLMPILDSVITKSLSLGHGDRWKTLSEVLDKPTRDALAGLSEAADGAAPSILRLLDVLTWMRSSESERARDVRRGLGFKVEER